MASRNPARPLSPHLSIWRWGPHMLVSILHRVTGSGMATVGTAILVWWLAAVAGGPASYQHFYHVFFELWGGAIGYVVGVGLTLSLFQHMMTGIRHFFLDAGAGFELKTNKTWSMMTMVASVALTILFWAYVGVVK